MAIQTQAERYAKLSSQDHLTDDQLDELQALEDNATYCGNCVIYFEDQSEYDRILKTTHNG